MRLNSTPEEMIGHLSDTIRCGITAPDDKLLVVCDLSSIESRVLGWVSGCVRINEIFATGKDTYRDFATRVFNVPYDDVTGEQRTYCKPPELGCGYQLGGPGLVAYADGYGVELTEDEGQSLVDIWRESNPEVVTMWYWLLDACKAVTEDLSCQTRFTGYGVHIWRDQNFLFITLPSGRDIAYYQPLVQPRVPPWGGNPRPTLTYMGMNQYKNKWERLTTHGGKITENIVQAIARDVLGVHMQVITRKHAVMDIIGHVHDEILCEVDGEAAEISLAIMREVMSHTPDWAPGLLLDAAGFITKRYRKD